MEQHRVSDSLAVFQTWGRNGLLSWQKLVEGDEWKKTVNGTRGHEGLTVDSLSRSKSINGIQHGLNFP